MVDLTPVTAAVVVDMRRILDLPATLIPDTILEPVASSAVTRVWELLTPDLDHTVHESDRTAALLVAVQLWQAQRAPGGTMLDADLGPILAPHLAGPGLLARVRGLLGNCYNVRSMIG